METPQKPSVFNPDEIFASARVNLIASLVTPKTLLLWHQRLIARKYDGSRHRGPGRPRTAKEIRELILKMAGQNRSWGYTRILPGH